MCNSVDKLLIFFQFEFNGTRAGGGGGGGGVDREFLFQKCERSQEGGPSSANMYEQGGRGQSKKNNFMRT